MYPDRISTGESGFPSPDEKLSPIPTIRRSRTQTDACDSFVPSGKVTETSTPRSSSGTSGSKGILASTSSLHGFSVCPLTPPEPITNIAFLRLPTALSDRWFLDCKRHAMCLRTYIVGP